MAWGYNGYGEGQPPPGANSGFVKIACGGWHNLGLKTDGTIVAWGDNTYRQSNVPEPNANFLGISARGGISMALKVTPVSSVEGPPAAPTSEVAGLRLLAVAPNPFRSSARIAFEVLRPDRFRLEVADVTGRLVTSVPLGAIPPGFHAAWWDGRDTRGVAAPAGVYFLRLQGETRPSRQARAVRVR